jgi:hypothetical protein
MIALDLDNTIICYDEAFRAAASQLDCLPEPGIAINKSTIKTSALTCGGNDLWTRVQGLAYGEHIGNGTLFPGCAEFVALAQEELVIVSHKTQFPVLGDKTDLREAAANWIHSTPLAGLPLYFFDTREAKVAKIFELRPRALIDDLPEVFQTPSFPPETIFHLFDPDNSHTSWTATPRIRSWREAQSELLPH